MAGDVLENGLESPRWCEMNIGTRKLLVHDTLDDRREIYLLLSRLSPRHRVAWLERSCRLAMLPRSRTHPHVSLKMYARAEAAMRDDSLDGPLTVECFIDFWTMVANYSLDVERALEILVEMARWK